MSSTSPQAVNPYARTADDIREPPKGFLPSLRFLGPSFVLIGSIVGSGELILTTRFGALAGLAGLWFILLCCVAKTIVQAELGRYTISSGDTCLEAFNRLPGPRLRAGWFLWLFVLWQIPGLINGGAILGSTGQVLAVAFPGAGLPQHVWGFILAGINVSLLLYGRYRFVERASTFMVMSFSAITILGALALQFTDQAVPWTDALNGLRIQLAPIIAPAVLATAIATFAGTGVGGGELMSYTYWCVEKGYARYTGPRTLDADWERRAKGWVRVMQIDVWLATAVFTLGTVAFFWLGAGVLHRGGLVPEDSQMIVTIRNIYTGSLGAWASALFLLGGFFVLYSTLFCGLAGTARIYADILGVFKLVDFADFHNRMKWIRIFTVLVPLVQSLTFAWHGKPQTVLILTAIAGGLLTPVIAFGTIWLRYRLLDKRIAPGKLSDAALWVCSGVILVVSTAGMLIELVKQIRGA
ncbi:MAG: Nramp family divalent metal transporter [Armatimonadota bacterium]